MKQPIEFIGEVFTIVDLDHAHLLIDLADSKQTSDATKAITSMFGSVIGEKVIDAIGENFGESVVRSSELNVITRRQDNVLRVLMIISVKVVNPKREKEVRSYLEKAFAAVSETFNEESNRSFISQVITSVSKTE